MSDDIGSVRTREAVAERAALKAASVNGVAVNFSAQMLRFALQFAYQILMARILAPADFGIVAMASPVLAFVGLFADFGLTQATVQRPDITQAQINLIFWANFLLSAILAGVTMLAAPAIAGFYGEPKVAPVVAVLGSTFLLGGLYAQHLALLNRRLAFLKLALIDLFGFAAGAAAGLAAAIMGARHWALVLNQTVSMGLTLILAWGLAGWQPGRPRRTADARALLGFGSNITTFNVVNYFARNLDNVLIGKFVGEVGLGIYDRAYKLLLLPLGQVTAPLAKVAIPLLSRLRDDPEAYRRAYLRCVGGMCLLTYPGVAFAMSNSRLLIDTVLGTKWQGVAPVFSILAIGAYFAPISNSTGWLFIVQDRTREMRNWGAVSSAMFVAAFVAGLPWGPVGVATAYIAVGTLQGPMVWWAATRRGPVSFGHLVNGLLPYAMGLVSTLIVQVLIRWAMHPIPITLIVSAAIAYPAFLPGMLVTSRGRMELKNIVDQLKSLLLK